ncbi:UvrD-helicase domain-containing protein [Burkholderia pseudomallei]|uniref:UvrD-helicase domain-containing protein n=1 Tax=Burkholderia pseudomallei TaxID=28450 RepID=UPI000F067C37|nr:ATP-dependent helicase [Burkholderia pseudomallei]VBT28183.1 DNA helicase II [Burkholderia pseudomallei]
MRLPTEAQNAKSKILVVKFGFDKIEARFADATPDIPLDMWKHRRPKPKLWPYVEKFHSYWKSHFEAVAMTHKELIELSEAINTKYHNEVKYLEIAFDLLTESTDDALSLRNFFLKYFLLDTRRFHQPAIFYKTTVYFKASDREFVMYYDKPSKQARDTDMDRMPCLHIELRLKTLAAVREYGIFSVRDLTHFDHHSFWKKLLMLYRISSKEELGRILDPEATGPTLYRRANSYLEEHSEEDTVILHNCVLAKPEIANILDPLPNNVFLDSRPKPALLPDIAKPTALPSPPPTPKPKLANFIPTSEQQEVIDSKFSRILVKAGPGTGKSSTLKAIVKRLIEVDADPKRICCISFSNRAVNELQERMGASRVEILTIHKLAVRIIKLADWSLPKGSRKEVFRKQIAMAIDAMKSGIQLPYEYLILDECQDTESDQSGIDQLSLVLMVSQQVQKVIVFGDEDQRIFLFNPKTYRPYDWAKLLNARTFEFTLSNRLTDQIVALANGYNGGNLRGRGPGVEPILIFCPTQSRMIRAITTRIRNMIRDDGESAASMTVLTRTNAQQRDIDVHLMRLGINTEPSYYDSQFFRLPKVFHLIETMMRFVDLPKDQRATKEVATLIDEFAVKSLSKDQHKEARRKFWLGVRALTFSGMYVAAGRLYTYLISGADQFDADDDDLEDHDNPKKAKNPMVCEINRWVPLSAGFTNVHDFRRFLEVLKEQPAVQISTVSSYKGGENDYIFVHGVTDGNFPHHMSFHDVNQLQAERNLFFVAITRPYKELFLYTGPVHFVNWHKPKGANETVLTANQLSRFLEPLLGLMNQRELAGNPILTTRIGRP